MRVFIAGVAGHTGRLLAERLLIEPDIDAVTGIDARVCYPPIAGLRFVRVRPCQPEWLSLLDDADAAIHLGGLRWPPPWSRRKQEERLVEESKFFLRGVASAGVPKTIMLTSAALYGPQPPGPVTERSPVRGHEAGAYARARAQVSDVLDGMRYNGVLSRLRVAWLCGPRHLALIRAFDSGPARACGYEDRVLDVLHEDDLITAVLVTLRRDLPGIHNVGASGGIRLRDAVALVNDHQMCVPLGWLVVRAWMRWRWMRWRTPPLWVRSLYDTRPLDTSKFRAAGWTPRHPPRQAMIEALEVFRAMGKESES
jgi:UDP-glucose 4-epimerase